MTQPPTEPGDVPAADQPQPTNFPPTNFPPSGGYPPPGAYLPPGNFPPSGGAYPPPPPGAGFPPPGNFPPPGGAYPPPPPGAGFLPPGNFPPPGGAYPPPPPGAGFPPPANFPPPGAGYPPPPPGWGYPPPAPGAFPPPGPQGAYFPPPPGWGRPAYSVGEAFTWAWNKFTKNVGPLLVATLVYFVVGGVVYALGRVLISAVSPETVTAINDGGSIIESTTRSLTVGSVAMTLLLSLVQAAVSGVVAAALYTGLLDIADGRPVTYGSFFRPRSVVPVILASLIVGVLTEIGLLMCIIPGLIVTLFTWFTSVAIVDRNLSPIDGIRASVDVVKANFGPVLLAALVGFAINVVGFLACGVGLLVAAPVCSLFVVYTWRKLGGGTVVP